MYIEHPFEIWRDLHIIDMFTNFIQVKSLSEMMMRTTTINCALILLSEIKAKHSVNLLSNTSQITWFQFPPLKICHWLDDFDTRCMCKLCDIMIIIVWCGRCPFTICQSKYLPDHRSIQFLILRPKDCKYLGVNLEVHLVPPDYHPIPHLFKIE